MKENNFKLSKGLPITLTIVLLGPLMNLIIKVITKDFTKMNLTIIISIISLIFVYVTWYLFLKTERRK